MGLLSVGSPLSWSETKKHADHVRKHAVIQFINLYNRVKDRENDCLKWGDEVEYMVVNIDPETKTARLCLKAGELLPILEEPENTDPSTADSLWRPEFASYMVEGTPGRPYGALISHFNIVEANMRARRYEVEKLLGPNEHLLCVTAFPRLGCPNFTVPPTEANPKGNSGSLFFPDEATYNEHPRFSTLVRNVRARRGRKVIINVPIYRDLYTPWPFTEDFEKLGDDGEAARGALPNHVYMDAMGFGMGNCCLQVTFQACNINEARTLYDQLAPICPIVMALSAAAPIFRGYLTERDCRWDVISASVDARTEEELGEKPLKNDRFRIKKSRYDTISCYISEAGQPFNDEDVVYDPETYNTLREAGIDHLLAQHVAHLLIRDPISLFREKLEQDDEKETDHFENLQSTNWNSMRFKPPPPNTSIGWRVEFRPTELQMTEFENAAFVVFIVLLTRVILSYGVNFLMPISKVDINMKEAQKRDAARKSLFWFRRDVLCTSDHHVENHCDDKNPAAADIVQMTCNEIINGRGSEFPGLVPLIKTYVHSMDVDVDTRCTIHHYLNLISKRASGEFYTTATWIRAFVLSHVDYQRNSVVSERICYDLLRTMTDIQQQKRGCPELFGEWCSKTRTNIPRAVLRAEFPNQLRSNSILGTDSIVVPALSPRAK